jgi:hypothetical protein
VYIEGAHIHAHARRKHPQRAAELPVADEPHACRQVQPLSRAESSTDHSPQTAVPDAALAGSANANPLQVPAPNR